ncbi:hypothetical protein [Micromonospora wenchangensis]|uniref:hypothetical protein n=1 Tax=Micromonospora wenchangensis TaxID=1185415 RepID=UPI003D754ECD
MNERPRPGDLLIVDRAASVQFTGERALRLRVVSVSDRPTYDGWVWLTGYVLDRRGEATAKREVFVRLAGLRPAATTSPPRGGRRTTGSPPSVTGVGRRAVAPQTHAARHTAGPPGVGRRADRQAAGPDGARR